MPLLTPSKALLLLIYCALLPLAPLNATVFDSQPLLNDSNLSSNPGSPALPTANDANQFYYDSGAQRVRWKTDNSSRSGQNDTLTFTAIDLSDDSTIINDPDYSAEQTYLTSITPTFSSADFALASTSKLDAQAEIELHWQLTVDTIDATFIATSQTASFLDGDHAGSNTAAINALSNALNTFNWDNDPFTGQGICYATIESITLELIAETATPNDNATGSSWFNLNAISIQYSAEIIEPGFNAAYFTTGANFSDQSITPAQVVDNNESVTFNHDAQSTFEIDRSGALRRSDQLSTLGTITFGGSLLVQPLASSESFEAGDAFRLFKAESFSGRFTTITLPPLDNGLEWDTTSLDNSGFIWVRPTDTTLPAKPNIIILFADDLGYADAGFQKLSEDIVTPHIDSIANNGVIYTAGYANGPVCAPSRGALMTGQYQNRFALHDTPATWHREALDDEGDPILGVPMQDGIPTDMTCFGHRMQALGYATCMIGKWHGGDSREHFPPYRGFDEFFGFNNGATNYFPGDNNNSNLNRRIMRGMFPVEREDAYITDAFGREAVSFINRHADEPFFLYVPFNAPHGPMHASDEHSQILFEKNADALTLREKLVSMVYSMDLAVGEILNAVRTNKLESNTLIFFFSDNGGIPSGNGSLNTSLRGQKGDLWEGGIRVPFCAQWKGHLPAGIAHDFVVTSLDMLPTAVDLAGGSFEPEAIIDGNNLYPATIGQTSTAPNDIVFWWHNDRWIARNNTWKLVQMDRNAATPELYNLKTDLAETTNLYDSYPAIASELQSAYDAILPEFDTETDASVWSESSTYYMNITDPAYHVIYDPQTVSEWIEANVAGAGRGFDHDGDGLNALKEFALGLNDNQPSTNGDGVTVDLSNTHPRIQFKRRIDDLNTVVDNDGTKSAPSVTYTLEYTPDLSQHWSSTGWTLIDGPTNIPNSSYQNVTFEHDSTHGESTSGFYRLSISTPTL